VAAGAGRKGGDWGRKTQRKSAAGGGKGGKSRKTQGKRYRHNPSHFILWNVLRLSEKQAKGKKPTAAGMKQINRKGNKNGVG